MYCDTQKKIWKNPDIQMIHRTPRSVESYGYAILESTTALIAHAARATWEITAFEFRYEPAGANKVTRNQVAIDLLDDWLQEDAGDQAITWKQISKAIDENRLSSRKLFS